MMNMKKRILSLALALVMALSCAPIAGAAVSSSDAQAYLSAMEKRPDASAFLIDFDGNGQDELLLVWTEWKDYYDQYYFEVWSGSKKLVSQACETNIWGARPYIARKTGDSSKLYLSDNYGNPNWGQCMNTYTVASNKWKLVDEFSSSYSYSDEHPSTFKINGKSYDEWTYLDLFQNTYDYVSSYDLSQPDYTIRNRLMNSIVTTLPLDDTLSTLSSRQKTALFDDLLCPFAGYDIDFRTASEKAIVDVMHSVWYDHDKEYDFGFDRSLTYHEGLSKAKLDTVTSNLFGRTINLAPFARNSEPNPEDMASYCFSYKNALYFHAYFGMGSFPGYIDTVPLHLYHIGNDYYCAIQKELWYEDGGSLCDQCIYSSVIKKNTDGTWQLVRLYPNCYVPTTSELSAFVVPSSWAKAEVEAADKAGLIPDLTGDPGWQDASTRLQFCQLAVQLAETALGETLPAAPANTFTDCSDLAVRKAYAAGIVNGMTETTFSPNGTLTREQLATMLWRAVNYIQTQSGDQTLTGGGSLTGYTDAGSVSSYAKEAVSALNKNGIMKGTSNTALSPKGSCTVEQSVLLSYRTFLKLN